MRSQWKFFVAYQKVLKNSTSYVFAWNFNQGHLLNKWFAHNRNEVAVQILAYQKVLKNSTSYVFATYSSNPFFMEWGQRTCHVSDNGNLLSFFFLLKTWIFKNLCSKLITSRFHEFWRMTEIDAIQSQC